MTVGGEPACFRIRSYTKELLLSVLFSRSFGPPKEPKAYGWKVTGHSFIFPKPFFDIELVL